MLKLKFFLDELSFLWRSLHSGGGGEITESWESCFGTQEGEWAQDERKDCGVTPWGCGHQAAYRMISFSIRLAKTATAKGGWG